jgi:hypothetical protein
MDLTVMAPTERHGELIADLPPERSTLSETQMMGIRGLPTANEAWLLCHISDVVAISDPARHR